MNKEPFIPNTPQRTARGDQPQPLLQYKLGSALFFLGIVTLFKWHTHVMTSIYVMFIGMAIFVNTAIPYIFRGQKSNTQICKIPRCPFFSTLLASYTLTFCLITIFWIFLTYQVLKDVIAPNNESWLVFSLLLFTSWFLISFRHLQGGTIRFFKFLLDNQFNIVIFRRFRAQAHLHRTLISPTFGAYGRIVAIRDDSLMHADGEYVPFSAEVLGEPYASIACDDSEWQAKIVRELRIADLVVFHWPEVPSPNMEWEFFEARKFVPSDRLIWLCAPETVKDIEVWLRVKAGSDPAQLTIITADVNDNYSNVKDVIYQKLSTLKVTTRPESNDQLHTTAR